MSSTSNPSPNPNPTPRLYFAYGSNLSLTQMRARCPSSPYHSLAILRQHRWIIGPRGYANVVAVPNAESSSSEGGREGGTVVWGMLYVLDEGDGRRLDQAEGVPVAYVKRWLDVEVVRGNAAEGKGIGEGRGITGEVVKALVYIDEKRTDEGVCKEEYMHRMNRGLEDAMHLGMEREWVEGNVRRWVREEEVVGSVRDPFLLGGAGDVDVDDGSGGGSEKG